MLSFLLHIPIKTTHPSLHIHTTTKPVSLSKPSLTCGILPKKCHMALSLLRTQTVPLAMRDIAHSTRGRILSGRRSTFFGCLTSGILSGRHSTFSGCLTSGILSSPDVSHPESCSADVPPSPDISHPAPDAGWERGRFNFPHQTCQDPLMALTWRASAADNSNSPDSLARQILVIRRIHFLLESKSKFR